VLEKTRAIIKHGKPGGMREDGSPSPYKGKIEAIFIENQAGERWKCPINSARLAEAMMRHVANGGLPYDAVGESIVNMAADIVKLKEFGRYVARGDLMNNNTSPIVERATVKLESLKQQLGSLSRQHHYEAYKTNFESTMTTNADQPLIDEVTLEDFKDKFTVKSFSENIADVFPLLHRIMQEESEIDLEEVSQEQDMSRELDLESVVRETPEMAFDAWASTLVETQLSQEELGRLQELVSGHFPVGVNGDNVTATLEELGLQLPDDTKVSLAQLAEQSGPDADAKDLVLEYLGTYEPQVLNALGVPVQEGGKLDFLSKAAGKVGDVLTKVATDPMSRLGAAAGALGATGAYQANKEKEEPAKENMDQTPEEKRHAMEYLNKVARAIRAGEVQPEEVEQEFFNTLPMLGVSDEKTYAAWDRITGEPKQSARPAMSDADIDAELRGVKGGDEDDDSSFLNKLRSQAKGGSIRADHTGFGAEVDESGMEQEPSKPGMKQVAEFIMGFYDRNTGNFPLGETGVQIKVEKEFGEQAGNLARQLIEKMALQGQRGQRDEFSDIRRLSGLGEAKSKKAEKDFDGDKKIETEKEEHAGVVDNAIKANAKESVNFSDLMVLSGLRK
jgi:hypothetical protein